MPRSPAQRRATGSNPRLRASPNFVQTLTLDGRPYIAQDTEPYIQYWLTERYRVLLSLFSARRGLRIDEAIAGWHRLQGSEPSPAEERRLRRAIEDMRSAGVLLAEADDTSRYDRAIAEAYVAHRPFPPEIARQLIDRGGVVRTSRVLDLAGGPGDLALALAEASDAVSLMELSRGFLDAAAERASARGLKLQTLHDSCNRLLHRDDPFDVITVSQALHWLDDVQVCRGVCRLLQADGSFFVVHSAIELPDAHPMAWLLGHDSILGRKERQPFARELAPIVRRLRGLFEALDSSEVQRADLRQDFRTKLSNQRIGLAGVQLFAQQRAFGPGYARGFLTPRHIAATGMSPEQLWLQVDTACAAAAGEDLLGMHRWAVLHFKRGADLGLPEPAMDGPGLSIAPPVLPTGVRP